MLGYMLKIRFSNIERLIERNFSAVPISRLESRKVELIKFMKHELHESDASSPLVRKYLQKLSGNDSLRRRYQKLDMKQEGISHENRLLAAFEMENKDTDDDKDGLKKISPDLSDIHIGSLMDLLNCEDSDRDDEHEHDEDCFRTSRNVTTTISPHNRDSSRSKSLFDLLEEDYPMEDSISQSTDQASVENHQQKFVLDLLDEDSSIDKSTDIQLSSNNHQKSLLDLLDKDFFATHEFDKTDNKQHQSSKKADVFQAKTLMDILDVESFGVGSDENDFQNRSLIDLLGDDDMSNSKGEIVHSNYDTVDQSKSLMDLLDKDSIPTNGTVAIHDGSGESHLAAIGKNMMNSLHHDTNEKESMEHGNSADEWIDELISGASTNKYTMTTKDYNTLLLYISTFTPEHDERINRLISVYAQMLELEESGIKDVAPDCTTFSILITILSQSKLYRGIALELCSHALSRIISNDKEAANRPIELDHDLLLACMKILLRQRKLEEAEKLLAHALDEEKSDIHVRPVVFRSMIELYKTADMQRKALDLLKLCLRKENFNRASDDELNFFLQSVITWPRKNRQGKRVSTTRYYTDLVDMLLEIQSSGYLIRQRIWESLLDTSVILAKVESDSNWNLAEKCCSALLGNNLTAMSPKFLDLGLEISQKVKNPEIIHHILERMDQDPVDSSSRVPADIYMKAIQLCVDARKPHLADHILRGAMRSKIPTTILSNMYSMVMTGYVQIGDSEKTEDMFHQIEAAGLSKSDSAYAVFINALNLNNKYDDALDLLRKLSDESIETETNPNIIWYNACILNALQRNKFDDVLEIDRMMKKASISHNSSTLQGVIIAKSKLGDKESVRKTIDDAIQLQTPLDYVTFTSCLKCLLPHLCSLQQLDVAIIRSELRKMAEKNESISNEAMALNRSLMDCLREQNRVPSNMRSEQKILLLQNQLWRNALKNALTLSAKL